MSQANTSPEKFAYGRNKVIQDFGQHCKCPALIAGYTPGIENRDVTEVAEYYDEKVKEVLRERGIEWGFQGVVDKNVAREAWNRTIENFLDEDPKVRGEIAVEIAEELGWR